MVQRVSSALEVVVGALHFDILDINVTNDSCTCMINQSEYMCVCMYKIQRDFDVRNNLSIYDYICII